MLYDNMRITEFNFEYSYKMLRTLFLTQEIIFFFNKEHNVSVNFRVSYNLK